MRKGCNDAIVLSEVLIIEQVSWDGRVLDALLSH